MNIRQFRYGSDNFAYLVFGETQALAIDPGAADDMTAFADSNKLDIRWAANTHAHPDHTSGNRRLTDRTKAQYLDNQTLRSRKSLEIEGVSVRILHTPGHTADSVCFLAGQTVITGDTLFNGTVGNCFSGDFKSFYHSVKQLMALPPETRVYAGHDYVRDSMIFAREVEPDNPHIDGFLKKYNPEHVFSTIQDELNVNPFMRFNEPEITTFLNNIGRPTGTEYDRWHSIMQVG